MISSWSHDWSLGTEAWHRKTRHVLILCTTEAFKRTEVRYPALQASHSHTRKVINIVRHHGNRRESDRRHLKLLAQLLLSQQLDPWGSLTNSWVELLIRGHECSRCGRTVSENNCSRVISYIYTRVAVRDPRWAPSRLPLTAAPQSHIITAFCVFLCIFRSGFKSRIHHLPTWKSWKAISTTEESLERYSVEFLLDLKSKFERPLISFLSGI